MIEAITLYVSIGLMLSVYELFMLKSLGLLGLIIKEVKRESSKSNFKQPTDKEWETMTIIAFTIFYVVAWPMIISKYMK